MIALFNAMPSYCPQCGKDLGHFASRLNQYDWQNFCSFTCNNCNTHYQRAKTDVIIRASIETGGDMAHYADDVGGG